MPILFLADWSCGGSPGGNNNARNEYPPPVKVPPPTGNDAAVDAAAPDVSHNPDAGPDSQALPPDSLSPDSSDAGVSGDVSPDASLADASSDAYLPPVDSTPPDQGTPPDMSPADASVPPDGSVPPDAFIPSPDSGELLDPQMCDQDGDLYVNPDVVSDPASALALMCQGVAGQMNLRMDSPDCDDTNAAINPGAAEIADNAVDEDCDGVANQTPPPNHDVDRDGFNAGQGPRDDWNDNDPTVHPGAEEIANNDVDENQDGLIGLDTDGDNHISLETGGDDFNDEEPNAYPGAAEVPYDGIDNDGVDGDLVDVDGDGFASVLVAGGRDTDDNNRAINPDAQEIPYNGIDEDSDGADLVDVDNDGFAATQAGGDDFNDNEITAFPGAQEIPNDGIDQDGDGSDLVVPPPPPPRPGICDQVGEVPLANATVAVPGRNTPAVGVETRVNGRDVQLIGSPFERKVYVVDSNVLNEPGQVALNQNASGVIQINSRGLFGDSVNLVQNEQGQTSGVVIGAGFNGGGDQANGLGDGTGTGGFVFVDATHPVFQAGQGQQSLNLSYDNLQPGGLPQGVAVLLGQPSQAIGAKAVVKGGEIFFPAGNASDCMVLPVNLIQGVKNTEQVRIEAQQNGINTPRFVHDRADPAYAPACEEIGILDTQNDRYYVMKQAGIGRTGVRLVRKSPDLPLAVVFPQPENTWFFTILPNGNIDELGSRIVTKKLHGPDGPESLLLTAPGEVTNPGQIINAGVVYLIPGPELQNALPNIQNGEGIRIDDLIAITGGKKFMGDQENGRLGDNGVALIPAGTDANREPNFHVMIGAQFFSGEGLVDSGCTFAMCNQTFPGMPQEGFIRQIAPTWVEGNAGQLLGSGMFSGPWHLGIRDDYGNHVIYPITSQQQH